MNAYAKAYHWVSKQIFFYKQVILSCKDPSDDKLSFSKKKLLLKMLK
jgi:hypothetical protein